jgi:hypothetical protein
MSSPGKSAKRVFRQGTRQSILLARRIRLRCTRFIRPAKERLAEGATYLLLEAVDIKTKDA